MIGRGRRPTPWTEAELEQVETARQAGETLRAIAARHSVSAQHVRLLLFRIETWRRFGLPLAPPFRQMPPDVAAACVTERIAELQGKLATMPRKDERRGHLTYELQCYEARLRRLRRDQLG